AAIYGAGHRRPFVGQVSEGMARRSRRTLARRRIMTTSCRIETASRQAHTQRGIGVGLHATPPPANAQPSQGQRVARGNRLAALAQATGQMVWAMRAEGSVVDAPSWRAFTGQTARQVSGWGWLDAVHPDDRERIERRWAQALASETPFECEYRARRYDGVYRVVAGAAAPGPRAPCEGRERVSAGTRLTQHR